MQCLLPRPVRLEGRPGVGGRLAGCRQLLACRCCSHGSCRRMAWIGSIEPGCTALELSSVCASDIADSESRGRGGADRIRVDQRAVSRCCCPCQYSVSTIHPCRQCCWRRHMTASL